MSPKLLNVWENMRASLWFVPSLFVLLAVLLAQALLWVDTTLNARVSLTSRWLVEGNPDSARAILALLAGSLVTAISIAYSITIIAIQQTSAQFSPRVLRTLTANRGNQVVLGTYMGTFIYALLILRQIRDETDVGRAFVPPLSITVAMTLALLCLALLIYFLHHIAQLLQVSVIIANVHREMVAEFDQFFPTSMSAGLADRPSDLASEGLPALAGDVLYLRATNGGFLRAIDDKLLVAVSDGRTPWLHVIPQVGDYVPHLGVLVEYPRDTRLGEEQIEGIRSAFVLDVERTINQDPLFGIRQLADIALKALSPAINDPTTAEYCLSRLGDALGQLCRRPFPSNERVGVAGGTRYIFNQPSWEEFVDTAFSQIRRQAARDVHVTGHLLHVLYKVAICIPPDRRAQALRRQLAEIEYVLEHGDFSPGDAAMLRREVDLVETALSQQPDYVMVPDTNISSSV